MRIWSLQPALGTSTAPAAPILASEIWHPREVLQIKWHADLATCVTIITRTVRALKAERRPKLITGTKGGVCRIYSTMPDEPDFFTLFATIQHPYTIAKPLYSLWLEKSTLRDGSDDDQMATAAEDTVVTLFEDGSVGVIEVSVSSVPLPP